MQTTDDIQEYLPLSETTYFILLSLSSRPRHGYAIMKDVDGLSHGRVKLSTGTLYSSLKRLLEAGWIERSAAPEQPLDGRGRKDYRLTRMGQAILEAEYQRLQSLVRVAHPRIRDRAA